MKVYKYGANVDTDVIIPARHLNDPSPAALASHCMEDIDPDFSSTVEEGDIITIDIPNCRIDVLVDEAVLDARKAKWVCPEPRVKTGYLNRYAKQVTSAARGAVLE